MGANRAILLLVAVSLPLAAQTAPRKPAHPPAAAVASAVLLREAEAAIDRQDFAAAEPKLLQATLQDPKDYRAWFDLGFVYSSTGRKPQAVDAYRRSVELKPDVFESNLNLGVLLAASDDPQAERGAGTRLDRPGHVPCCQPARSGHPRLRSGLPAEAFRSISVRRSRHTLGKAG
jgi:Tfp pilus assembly protein PilF